MTAPLRVWAVSDGRAGIEAQALGLAEAVARLRPAEVTPRRVSWPRWAARIPTQLVPASIVQVDGRSDPISGPWPELWIAAGRAAIPLSIAVRRWSDRRTFVVQVQDPLRGAHRFDLIVPPNHDGLVGPTVFGITGAPHRITPDRLQAELEPFRELLETMPRPHVVALIGGRSKAFGLSKARAGRLAQQIGGAVRGSGGSLLLTFSRRTPPEAEAILREGLKGLPGLLWSGEGRNPYGAFLATADAILVTEDSANMPTEAAATGKPVYLLEMDGAQARKQRFHAELAALGVARPFEGRLETWSYAPLDETKRAAREILRRMNERELRPAEG